MGLVLDSCVFVDLSLLNQRDPRFISLDRRVDQEACYITPIEAAETHFRISKDVDSSLAEMVLAEMRRGPGVRISKAEELIEMASEARSYGVPPHIAFTAALARKLDAPILVGADYTERVGQYQRLEGFCRIEVY